MKFVAYYNNHHRIASNYVTPFQVHSGEHLEILTKRDELYEKAKEHKSRALDCKKDKNLDSNEWNLDNTTTRSHATTKGGE